MKARKKKNNATPMAHTVTLMAVDDLLPYAANARTHSADQIKRIAASIKEFGFNNPILIDGAKGIIAGHGRLAAAKKLDLVSVPVIELTHLTDAQRRAYILADNRLALDAGWDEGVLAEELKRLSEDAFDLSLTGFGQDELDKLLGAVAPTEGLTDEDDVPEVPQNVHGVERGQVWRLGRHRLMCGDSTDEAHVATLLNGRRGALCFTSPPYSDQRDYGGGKDLSTVKLAQFLRTPCDLFAVNLGMQRKDGEVFSYWDEYIASARKAGLKFLSWNVWDRAYAASIGQQTAMFAIEHEWILVFGAAIKNLNLTIENKTSGIPKGTGTNREKDGKMSDRRNRQTHSHRRLGTIIRQDIHRGAAPHPAMFPVSLPSAYVEACSNEGDLVFEPFGGSGTTAIACEMLNRECAVMELDPHYCSIIIERWQQFTGQKAELVG